MWGGVVWNDSDLPPSQNPTKTRINPAPGTKPPPNSMDWDKAEPPPRRHIPWDKVGVFLRKMKAKPRPAPLFWGEIGKISSFSHFPGGREGKGGFKDPDGWKKARFPC